MSIPVGEHDVPGRDAPPALLLTNGVHLIDRTAWLLDEFPTAVTGSIGRRFGSRQADDLDSIFLRFPSGASACLVLAQPTGGSARRTAEVLLTEGRLRYAEVLEVDQGQGWQRIPTPPDNSFDAQLAAFADAIAGGAVSPDGRWAREIVRIAELAAGIPSA